MSCRMRDRPVVGHLVEDRADADHAVDLARAPPRSRTSRPMASTVGLDHLPGELAALLQALDEARSCVESSAASKLKPSRPIALAAVSWLVSGRRRVSKRLAVARVDHRHRLARAAPELLLDARAMPSPVRAARRSPPPAGRPACRPIACGRRVGLDHVPTGRRDRRGRERRPRRWRRRARRPGRCSRPGRRGSSTTSSRRRGVVVGARLDLLAGAPPPGVIPLIFT